MIDLVIIYCLSANPKACVEKRVPFEDFGNPVACIGAAQLRAQEYLREHPKYKLDRWKCEVDVPQQSPA